MISRIKIIAVAGVLAVMLTVSGPLGSIASAQQLNDNERAGSRWAASSTSGTDSSTPLLGSRILAVDHVRIDPTVYKEFGNVVHWAKQDDLAIGPVGRNGFRDWVEVGYIAQCESPDDCAISATHPNGHPDIRRRLYCAEGERFYYNGVNYQGYRLDGSANYAGGGGPAFESQLSFGKRSGVEGGDGDQRWRRGLVGVSGERLADELEDVAILEPEAGDDREQALEEAAAGNAVGALVELT